MPVCPPNINTAFFLTRKKANTIVRQMPNISIENGGGDTLTIALKQFRSAKHLELGSGVLISGDERLPSPLESCCLLRCNWTKEKSAADFIAGLLGGRLQSFVITGPRGVAARTRSTANKALASFPMVVRALMVDKNTRFATTLRSVSINLGLQDVGMTASLVASLLTKLGQ